MLVFMDVAQSGIEQLGTPTLFLDAWLTEDLLNKLGNNDKLMTMMADPRCERALQEFQANPDKALITYQHDKYIQEFFREFCDVLGTQSNALRSASKISGF